MLTRVKAYNELENLIKERQLFEKNHPFPPYDLHKTDIDFFDVDGNTLLDYAILMGDLDKVKNLIMQGANINLVNLSEKLSPIELAAIHGEQEIAEFLYNQGAEIWLSLFISAHKKVKPWLHKMIKAAIAEAYPLPDKRGPLPYEIQKKENQFFGKDAAIYMPLYRAAQIGDLEFIKKFDEVLPNEFFSIVGPGYLGFEDLRVFNVAVANGQLEVIKYFLKKIAQLAPMQSLLDPNEPFKQSPLEMAIKSKQKKVINFLIEQSLNLEYENNIRQTPLMSAILAEDLETFELLINKGANIRHVDVHGRNILHLAILVGNAKMVYALLQHNEIQKLALLPDIYGFTPWDLALQSGNAEIIKSVKPDSDMTTIQKLPAFGFKPTKIIQDELNKKIYYYLLLNYRDLTFFSLIGHCNGYEYLFQYYAARGMEDYFYDTLRLISEWDGTASSLDKPFGNIPQRKFYKNLRELMEQWINDITWFQQNTLDASIKQYERVQQYTIIGDDTNYNPKIVYHFLMKYIENNQLFYENSDLLLEYVKYFSRLPPNIRIEFSGGGHATGGYINDKNDIIYYDPDFLYKANLPKNYQDLFPHIINYKYIFLKKIQRGNKIHFGIQLFYFNKDKIDLNSHKIFRDDELPKDEEQAQDFQNISPNKFTHLHIAILTHSLITLKQLLVEGYCDINAVDKFGRNPLELAILNNFEDATQLLLSQNDLILTGAEILAAYNTRQKKYVELFLSRPSPVGIDELFIYGIDHSDYELVEWLIKEKRVDVNKTSPNLPLIEAILSDDAKMVEILLKNKASVIKKRKIDKYNSISPLQIAIQQGNKTIYSLIISELPNLNSRDELDNTAVYYAMTNENFDLLEDLLKKGADVNLKDSSGKTALYYVMQKASFKKQIFKIIYPYLKFSLFEKPDRKLLAELLFYSIKTSDKEMFDLWLNKTNKVVLDTYSQSKLTALQYAVRNNQWDMVEELIKNGADINIKDNTDSGRTCLHYMIKKKYPEKYISFFLKQGASLDIPDNKDRTARDYLSEFGDESLKIFIENELKTQKSSP